MAALRGIVGGEITDYTKMLAEAREQALDRMVGTAYVMANVAEILVYGTAVTIEPE